MNTTNDSSHESSLLADGASLGGVVGDILRGGASLNEALSSLTAAICEHTGFDIAEAWVPRAEDHLLERRAVCDTTSRGAPKAAATKLSLNARGLPGLAWAGKRTEVRAASDDSRDLYGESMRLGIIGLLGAVAIPLLFDGDHVVCVVTAYVQDGAANVSTEAAGVERAAATLRHLIASHVLAEHLRAGESRFRAIADCTPTLIWTSRPDRSLEFANKALLELTGMELSELALRWARLIHPSDRERCDRVYNEAYLTRGEFELEYRFQAADGEYRAILERGAPRVLEDGLFHGLVGHGVDITRRQDLLSDLERMGRLQSAGELATGVAHDIRTLLGVIVGYADQIVAHAGRGAESDAAEIACAATRASEIAQHVLVLAQEGSGEPDVDNPVDVLDAIADIEPVLRSLLGPRVDVLVRADEHVPHVLLSRAKVHQVLVNLAVNARDAMPEGGAFAVEVTSDRRLSGKGKSGPGVIIRISDTGLGMEPAIASRAFEPFFSTKSTGTGIGLASVSRIVMQDGGTIELESEPGRGTTFTIALPAAQ